MENIPSITALICTRNRGESLVVTVKSILGNAHPGFELVVIDQSTNDETAEAISPFLIDPRIRYIRTTTQGLGTARNIGMAEARADVVAFTDDDCEVPSDWLEKIEGVFQGNPRVALMFCNVIAVPYDTHTGFIPAYERHGSKILSQMRHKCTARGIGAGLSVRRSVIQKIGGFDEMLGAGAIFFGCEDGDMAVRTLVKGYQVYETDCTFVLHSGFRAFKEGRELSRRDWFGIGAAYAKPIKGGYWRFAIVPAYEFFVLALWPPFHDLFRGRRPRGWMRIPSFIRGFQTGLRTPIDKDTLLFRQQCVATE